MTNGVQKQRGYLPRGRFPRKYMYRIQLQQNTKKKGNQNDLLTPEHAHNKNIGAIPNVLQNAR
jgi:hypothetical protein